MSVFVCVYIYFVCECVCLFVCVLCVLVLVCVWRTGAFSMREVRIVKNPFLASWFIPATLPLIRSRDIWRSSEKAWESVEGPDMYSLCSLWMTFRKTVWNLM